MARGAWTPLAPGTIEQIGGLFASMLPESEYGRLAAEITGYWTEMLASVWRGKEAFIKERDLNHDPSDPLSRIRQKTVVIAYPDSVRQGEDPALAVLDRFLKRFFPAVGGLHLLPACRIVQDRFNDGYFSQVRRDLVDPSFGTNGLLADLAARYYFMTDFVLNHVDIAHPKFEAFLNGDDAASACFYVFSENDYRKRRDRGDFDLIFRPRPFPLFTLFRRRPETASYAALDLQGRCMVMSEMLPAKPPLPVIGIFSIFDQIRNDQMLLDADYRFIEDFRRYLCSQGPVSPDELFTLSSVQETRHPPYIFQPHIRTRADLLRAMGYAAKSAASIADAYENLESLVFGEPIRALTTFSHVQVDVNTTTLAGLKLLADDFSGYLGLDLNMLRLDAANYAFKKWGTTCFGLPEVKQLIRILYLSMEAVAPRITANLEVNDTFVSVLSQLAAPDAPPMMYDFHLASLLPAVFNLQNAGILDRIQEKTAQFDIDHDRIRFSVVESHDGKSVRGSLDLLGASERRQLTEVVCRNSGRVKYKSAPARQIGRTEFEGLCAEAGKNPELTRSRLFKEDESDSGTLFLKDGITTSNEISDLFGISGSDRRTRDIIDFFAEKVLHGREPYELCVSTRDALVSLDDRQMEIDRYLAFYTLAFALTGRNIRTIYFNDLMGLGNDLSRMEATGELRDIKRTRSEYADLAGVIRNQTTFTHAAAGGINRLIALADSDPALHFRGNEARTCSAGRNAALVANHYQNHWSIALVNIAGRRIRAGFDLSEIGIPEGDTLFDNIAEGWIDLLPFEKPALELAPFQRLWLTPSRLTIS